MSVTPEDTDDESLDGIVIDQSPAPNTTAPKGSTVTIVVGRYVDPGGATDLGVDGG